MSTGANEPSTSQADNTVLSTSPAQRPLAGSNKVRFDGLDVTAMVAHLQRTVLGQRVVNIYDEQDSGSTYWIKLENKTSILLESGIRFHTTSRQRSSSNNMPSPFCAKLRKMLRGLRLEQVLQMGQGDRVVLFQFGLAQKKYALILELYSKGNLILVDGNTYRIQALLRSHAYENRADNDNNNDEVVQVQVGHVYPVTYATSWKAKTTTTTSPDEIADNPTDSTTDETNKASEGMLTWTADESRQWIQEQVEAKISSSQQQQQQQKGGKKSKKKSQNWTLKTILLQSQSGVSHYGPALLEHCILFAGLLPHDPLLQAPTLQDCQALLDSLRQEGPRIMDALQDTTTGNSEGTSDRPGYILYSERTSSSDETPDKPQELPHANKLLQEFQPHLLLQHQGRLYLTYPDFAAAVDDFFAHLVIQKRWLKAQAAESAARDKLEKVRQDQSDRLAALERGQDVMKEQAQAVQVNADNVDKALAVINSALDSGMDWDQLQELVAVEQKNGNVIAQLIHKLELDQDAMTLRLPNPDADDDDEESSTLLVQISLKESAHANASNLFAKYRASKEKAQKTVLASSKALKAAEETAMRQLEQAQKRANQATRLVKRKPAWYEKFHWFITSDNYLVIGGRDAHQNELVVKRYLRPGDAYLHADVHGAASCILRAKRRRLPNGKTETIPLSERALREAGNFTVCRSSAWTKKMVMSAWWVESDKVSKTAPTGEYLTVGSFMVRGKKNFLPPSQLEMGLAVLFRLGDDDSIARHNKERRDFALLELESSSPLQDEMDSETGNADTSAPLTDSVSETPTLSEPDLLVPEQENSNFDQQADLEDVSDKEEAEIVEASEEAASEDLPVSGDSTNDNNVGSPGGQEKKRGLSVKDRKLIKKYGSLEEARRVLAASAEEKKDADESSSTAPSTKAETTENGSNLKRGKKSKMKKAMKKYGEQDDEDRDLAMQALQGGEKSRKKGSGRNSKVKQTQVQEQVAAETVALLAKDAAKVAAQLPDEVQSVLAECVTVTLDGDYEQKDVRWDKFDAIALEQLTSLDTDAQLAAARRLLNLKQTTRVDNFSASLSGIIRTIHKYGHDNLNVEENPASAKRKTKAEKDAEALKWKQTLADEGVVDGDLEEDAVDDTAELSKLTGKPHPDDLILNAVPVCAPYQTLSQYTYRIKLTPGNLKRGKAAKQCAELFLRDDNNKSTSNHTKYKVFIKKVDDNDWMQAIVPDVKVSAAGASKAVKKNKAAGKKAKNKR